MRRTEFRALGGSRVYKGAIRGKQIGNPGLKASLPSPHKGPAEHGACGVEQVQPHSIRVYSLQRALECHGATGAPGAIRSTHSIALQWGTGVKKCK